MFTPINGFTRDQILQTIQDRPFRRRAIIKGSSSCEYKTPGGNKCAVGLFIPDGHAGQTFRGGVDDLLKAYPDLAARLPLNRAGLQSLQSVHDTAFDSGVFRGDARAAMLAWVLYTVSDKAV